MTEFFDLSHTLAKEELKQCTKAWEAVPRIRQMIEKLGPKTGYPEIAPQVWVADTATVAPSAYIGGPCIIGPGTEIRHGAFIRGSALIGENCVVGNSVEIKNAILFDGVQVPHFNYVGDSIMGYRSHLGAGCITSNVKSDKSPVGDTGLKKLGAIVGDGVEVGCNSVLNPGTVIGRGTTIYPLSSVRGTVPPNHIYKNPGEIIAKQ